MSYYPVNLDLREKLCLVVGGGDVAVRKVQTLLACGARVKVVAVEAASDLQDLADQGRIELAVRPFSAEDVAKDVFLVIASTDDTATNSQASRLAQEAGKLINVVDDPALCNFIVPATVTRGDLQISVSTSGRSPALAKRIRQQLEKSYGQEYQTYVDLLGELREVVKSKYPRQKDREAAFNRLLHGDILELVAAGDIETARKKAAECI